MKKYGIILLMASLFAQQSYAQTFNKDTLLYNGDISKLLNIVILPDGYTAGELTKFHTDANNFINFFFGQTPFSNYKNYFNVFAIDVPSNESGAKHPNTAPDCGSDTAITNPDNYFGSTFDRNNIHRLIVATKTSTINTVLFNNFPQYDIVLILVNTGWYGGSGGTYALATTHSLSAQVAIHEIGHSFGKLTDEYWNGSPREAPNMTKTWNPATIIWKNWLGINGVGIYQHTEDTTWHRPHQNCMMRYINKPFCSVCKDTIIEQIHSLTNAIYNYSPYSTTVYVNDENLPFILHTLKPIPNTLKILWTLDGSNYANNVDSISIDSSSLSVGSHTLSVTVIDTTFDTKSLSHSIAHLYSVQWHIYHSLSSIQIDAFDYITTVSVYPNPCKDELNIGYSIKKNSFIQIDLLNDQGLFLHTILNKKNITAGDYINRLSLKKLNVRAGVYFIRFNIDAYSLTKMIVKVD